jgi:hypothetical protein
VIDRSCVEMVDAAGLGALISAALKGQSQFSVKLAAPSNLIRQLLELTKLTSVFEVHPTFGGRHRRIQWTSDMTEQSRFTTSVSALKSTSTSLLRADHADRLALEGGTSSTNGLHSCALTGGAIPYH